ncbi:UDP-2,4-diacetamido-2,4,6-trideoxy-beta-L-altropyranose hydrolase [Hymenobacter terrenus]|uniref:UDP-2,4-diacetamido-2,4, 6-trideoxy-beta-L-altropyranose hydrolase n=1 Tax=Hymenobacter terrenus TaxID=1629124 RepID=UPI0006967D02|nr:UDP-2,4-diacetamido-2,4,6-trideoxy-beta-L-altropyranose hydrolase [Hymenobacter terrenus]
MTKPTRLVLRADGNARIGLGHVMRLVALADILRDGFEEYVFATHDAAALAPLLAESGLRAEPVPELPPPAEAAWLRDNLLSTTDVVVLDGYGFDFEYQQLVRAGSHRLVCLDDLHAFAFAADLVLNPAGGVTARDYELSPRARLLAGPAYAPLRAAFWQEQSAVTPASPDKILVCLGGADPRQLTQQVAANLMALSPAAEVHAVVGIAYLNWDALQQWAAHQPRLHLHRALDASALAQLMHQCGTAVLTPSTVSYEYCAAGGGLLLLLPTADNQHDLDLFLRGAGLALPYTSAANVLTSPERARLQAQLRAAQRQHFDGRAPTRLRQAFAALQLEPPPFRLRPICETDSDLLLTWSNDPTVRQSSFDPKPIDRATHEAWFVARLRDAHSLLLLAEDLRSSEPVGLIRFQLDDDVATLSYQLAATWRGQGLAAPLLVAGTEAAGAYYSDLRLVRGHVQALNQPSVRAFERAGFQRSAQAVASKPASENITFEWVVG